MGGIHSQCMCLTLWDPWTVAHQAPLPMEFSRQEYWSGLPFPTLGYLPNPGIEPASPALAGRFFTTVPTGKPSQYIHSTNSHHVNFKYTILCFSWGFSGGSVGGKKNPPANAGDAGDLGSISGSGTSPGKGNGNPLQDSCPKNPMDRGSWWATVHGVTKSKTQLSMHNNTCVCQLYLNKLKYK